MNYIEFKKILTEGGYSYESYAMQVGCDRVHHHLMVYEGDNTKIITISYYKRGSFIHPDFRCEYGDLISLNLRDLSNHMEDCTRYTFGDCISILIENDYFSTEYLRNNKLDELLG